MPFLFSSSASPTSTPTPAPFRFLDPGTLVNRDLHLVSPHERWIDDMLASCRHPLTQSRDEEWRETDRDDLLRLIQNAPDGKEPADPARSRVPAYHFWMRLDPASSPPVPFAGVINFRVGSSDDIHRYFGHLGYSVFPPARGNHYAERACRLLFPLARAHGFRTLWVTTGPENAASRRTCERLGGRLVETIDVPPSHPLHNRGQLRKCRYRIDL